MRNSRQNNHDWCGPEKYLPGDSEKNEQSGYIDTAKQTGGKFPVRLAGWRQMRLRILRGMANRYNRQ